MKWKNRKAVPSRAPVHQHVSSSEEAKEGPYDLIRALSDELAEIGKLQKKRNSPFVQRLFVRQFGSSLDAYAFYFQNRARESAESEGVQFTQDERVALHMRPEDTEADRFKPAYQQITKNMMFGIQIFAKVRGVDAPCTELPSEIAAAIRIRNRLTHPKKAADLALSAGELRVVAAAIQWLQKIASWGSREEVAYIDRIKQRLHDSIEKQKQEIMRGIVTPERPTSQ